MEIQWLYRPFKNLSAQQLYDAMILRQEVFIVEQQCIFVDADGVDPDCHHLFGYTPEGKLASYSRIVPPKRLYPEASIGRVVNSSMYRRHGIGKLTFQKAIELTEQLYGRCSIRIEAQYYLADFYAGFGFKEECPRYLLDGIWHVEMLRPAAT